MDAEVFWTHVDKSGACWLWTGTRNLQGYGTTTHRSLPIGAHRLAYELTHGFTIPAGMIVMHTCDNPPCVNPDHLRLGTQRDNVRDMTARGRSRTHLVRP